MRKIVFALGAAAAGLLVQAVAAQPAAAATVYPWCAHYGGTDYGNAPSCGSATLEQCRATVSGQLGYCARNPFYVEQAAPPPRRQKRARE